VFVSAGTDHHRFDTLMGWVGRWAAAHPDVHVVVQHGPADCPAGCEGHKIFSVQEMAAQLSAADVAVVSAGPGAVMAAREVGRKPIAVPRRVPEVVDDHQVAFARLMDQRGVAFGAEAESRFVELLDGALVDAAPFACERPSTDPPEASARFGAVVDAVVRGDGRR
jgi:UDP-N-acetylglucosamine transferase subunit ALG13